VTRKVPRAAALQRRAPGPDLGILPMNSTPKRAAMIPAINNNLTSSGQAAHTAGPPAGHQHTREMSWLPGPHGGRQPNPPPAGETAGP